MAVNKVVLGTEVQLDLTSDTIQASDLRQGITAHNKAGNQITGTAAMVYNSSTEELSLPNWTVIING